jgi:FMN phosphatase YigB (HAD superfamily)
VEARSLTSSPNDRPEIVVFDLGKVLLEFDYEIAIGKIAARGRVPEAEISRFLLRSPLLLQYESGSLGTADFYRQMCDTTGFCGSLDEFGLCFGDIFSPIEPMIQMQGALQRAGVPTFVFSNTNDLAIRHIRRAFPFFQNFTGYIFSYEHRSMKPEPGMYEALERASARRGEEIVYLDDRAENVHAGIARGWRGVVHESPERSKKALARLGLPVE